MKQVFHWGLAAVLIGAAWYQMEFRKYRWPPIYAFVLGLVVGMITLALVTH